jgi:hypothetical protein
VRHDLRLPCVSTDAQDSNQVAQTEAGCAAIYRKKIIGATVFCRIASAHAFWLIFEVFFVPD